jgi:hypothetical protein
MPKQFKKDCALINVAEASRERGLDLTAERYSYLRTKMNTAVKKVIDDDIAYFKNQE